MDIESPPLYTTTLSEENDSSTSHLPSLFDPALVHSIENEIDLDLVDEIAQDFDWVEDRFVKDTRATSGDILDEAGLNHLLGDLSRDDHDSDEPIETQAETDRMVAVEMVVSGDQSYEVREQNPCEILNPVPQIDSPSDNSSDLHTPFMLEVSHIPEKKSQNREKATPITVHSSPVTLSRPPSSTASICADEVTDAKSARRRRMDIMLQRKLGRYYSRQRATDSQIPPTELKIAAKAAVAAVLDTSVDINAGEVVIIARNLLKDNFPHLSTDQHSDPSLPPALSNTAILPENASSHTSPKNNGKVTNIKKTKRSSSTGRGKSTKPRKMKKDEIQDNQQLQSESVTMELPDGDDAESRRQRRLIRNRMSAQLHRERKREAMDTLKREIEQRDIELLKLRQQLEQALHRNTSLEFSLDLIKNHYGTSTVDGILKQTAPPSPPHLVNTSDSSDSETLSVPASPMTSSDIVPDVLSITQSRKRNVTELNPRKKKKLGGVLVMASLAFCGLVATIFSPGKDGVKKPFEPVTKFDDGWDEVDNSYPRRRLLSVTTSSGESLLDHQDLHESNKKDRHLISPIESVPSLWKLDHASHMTPWTYRHSHLFFDIRSDAAIFHQIATASLSLSTSIVALSSLLSLKKQFIGLDTETLHDRKASESSSTKKKTNGKGGLRGTATPPLEAEELSSLVDPLPALTQTFTTVKKITSSMTPLPETGSSFMFCPSAHASLSPKFLEWSGFNEMQSLIEENQDERDLDDDEQERPLKFENTQQNHGDRNDQNKKESTALVPSLSRKINKSKRPHTIVKTIMGGDDPYMTILLPASTFYGGNSQDEATPWVELGCQVLSARLVDGVEFREGTGKEEFVTVEESVEEESTFIL